MLGQVCNKILPESLKKFLEPDETVRKIRCTLEDTIGGTIQGIT